MHRLFVALRPPADIRAELTAIMSDVHGARWQDDDQLHLTILFIGDVDRHQANDIADALRQIRFSPISISLAGLGQFERRGRIDSLWIGAGPRQPLLHLHHKIDRACMSAGLAAEDRAYLPHVTLARFGRDAGSVETFLSRHAGFQSPPFDLDYFALFESHLGHTGATYHLIERYDASTV